MPHAVSRKTRSKPAAGSGVSSPLQSGRGQRGALLYKNGVSTLLAAALLLVLAGQVLAFMFANSRITDETAHMAAGYSYLKFRDFRLNPEHPPLIKELAAIPLLFMSLRFPSGGDWDQADQWGIGRRHTGA